MTKIDSFIVCRINLDEINGFLVTGVLSQAGNASSSSCDHKHAFMLIGAFAKFNT